jgi:hypothetical protein
MDLYLSRLQKEYPRERFLFKNNTTNIAVKSIIPEAFLLFLN